MHLDVDKSLVFAVIAAGSSNPDLLLSLAQHAVKHEHGLVVLRVPENTSYIRVHECGPYRETMQ